MRYYSEEVVKDIYKWGCGKENPPLGNYPSIEISDKHGDLIDKDELLNWKNITCVDTGYWETDYDCVKTEIILKAPTILEATE